MRANRVAFTAPGKVAIESFELPDPADDELFHRIQYVDEMRPVRAYRGHPDAGSSVQFEMINFSDAELKALPHLGDQRAYQRALLLE